ncbi:LysR family transcriptional regulator [Marinifaba aquimaris]|uniref:LysR family transcriptional regulator n=1 Tax=Marinifaba aquimaris TaxID=2741323 RepID=UPI003CCD419C
MKTRSQDLQILIAVVDSGGFSAAADKLDIQVAKVSRAVSRLEQQLNTTLINRTTRKIQLTEEGRDFVSQVRTGLQTLMQAEEGLLNLDNKPKGKLRVDAASPFVLHQIAPHVQAFQQAYPGIELALSSNEGYVSLLENKTDVAFRIGPLTDSSLHARFIGHSDLYIVTSPEYLAKNGVPKSFAELVQHTLIGFISSKNLNFWPLGEGVQIKPDITTSHGEVIRQLCLQGAG